MSATTAALPTEDTNNVEQASDASGEKKTTDNTATPNEKAVVEEKKPGRFDKTFEEHEAPKHALVDMSTIELTAEDLYDKDKVDLEQVELDDVWTLLQCVSLFRLLPASSRAAPPLCLFGTIRLALSATGE